MTSSIVLQKLRRTFPTVPNDIREWTRFFSNLFFSRAFTATLTGCTTSPIVEVRYTVSAGVVVLHVPAISGVSNNAGAVLTGLPDELVSSRSHRLLAPIIDNGVIALGQASLDEGIPAINLSTGLNDGGFTTSGTKGIGRCTLIYALD
jgi:hypothetical protein